MPDLRITGVPAVPGTIDTLLQEWFGYRATVLDGAWVISENDPSLRRGPPDALAIHHQIEIRDDNHREVAERMMAAVPAEFDEFAQNLAQNVPRNITVPGGLGGLSEIHALTTEIAVASNAQATECIATRLLPFIQEHFQLDYVVPVTVRAADTQQYLSFSKVATLAEHVGPNDAEALVREAKAFSGIELSSLDILKFVEPVTRLAPVAFTFAVNRHGCAWHFHGNTPLATDYLSCTSFFAEFLSSISPRAPGSTALALPRLPGMDHNNTWRVLATAVDGINSLFKFLNDHRNYAADDGSIDFLRQLQSFGAIHMLFADLQALNRTLDDHTRLAFAFSAIDKLANLRKNIGGFPQPESRIAENFASLRQGKELKSVFDSVIGDRRPDLLASLMPLVGQCYGRLHRHLGRECGTGSRDEAARLGRLRFSRNLSHGTFLNSGAFQTLFMRTSGTVPKEVLTLAFVLTWGLLLDPQRFLNFPPE